MGRSVYSVTGLLAAIAGIAAPVCGQDDGRVRPFTGEMRLVQPERMRLVRLVDGQRVEPLSPWMPAAAGRTHCNTHEYVFDAIQQDPCSDGPPSACYATGYWRGPTVTNPSWINDLTMTADGAGNQASYLEWAMHIGSNEPTGVKVYFFFANEFEDCAARNYGVSGIAFDFGSTEFDPETGVLVSSELVVGVDLPSTISGAYHGMIGTDETSDGTIILHPHAQPMLWGTGEDETPPDGRVGSQGPLQSDTDDPSDFQTVCRDYSVANPDPGVPSVLGAAFGVAVQGSASSCYADCTGDCELSVADFTCFRNAYLAGDTAAADCTGDGELSVADFTCFRNAYLAGCP